MKYLELHGDRVAYREAGAGEALLLIHGMAGSSATWRAVLAQLSKKYRVVAPDLLGHGESAKPRGDGRRWSVSRLVAVWPCSSPISIATTANGWFSSAAVAWAPT
jgi:pimeloyl-ACP methyl ester carboxylesterase